MLGNTHPTSTPYNPYCHLYYLRYLFSPANSWTITEIRNSCHKISIQWIYINHLYLHRLHSWHSYKRSICDLPESVETQCTHIFTNHYQLQTFNLPYCSFHLRDCKSLKFSFNVKNQIKWLMFNRCDNFQFGSRSNQANSIHRRHLLDCENVMVM